MTDSGSMGRLEALFHGARRLPKDQRGAWLAQQCGDDHALREDIERMLAADDECPPTSTPTVPPELDASELASGDRVGSFTVLEEIGHGGMGSVYLAEQREPVRRRAALKVIKLGMDSKAVLARFEIERQALAMMDHSHIAKVFEAGTTGSGRPYFAMEYVAGKPITRFADDRRLPLEKRLRLFKQVCSGVAHAHAIGVVHRDLTPNNVLVRLQDGRLAAKIIDFGLARAIDRENAERTLFTEQGVILGTPEYMSPEQSGLAGVDVDERSDIYTLGVLLYEMLTGGLPFASRELRARGWDVMCRVIREKEPPRPSTRVATSKGGLSAVAALRRTEPRALLRCLRGDLDWVVLKCLQKDPARRYQTVRELADDVQKHLDGHEVSARAPSLGYVWGKVLQRRRGQVLGGLSIVLALAMGLVVAMSSWRRAEEHREEAKQLRVRAEEQAARAAALLRVTNVQGDEARRRTLELAAAAADGRRRVEELQRDVESASREAEAARQEAEAAGQGAEAALAERRDLEWLIWVAELQVLQQGFERLSGPWNDLSEPRRWLEAVDRLIASRPAIEMARDEAMRLRHGSPLLIETRPAIGEAGESTKRAAQLDQVLATLNGAVSIPALSADDRQLTPQDCMYRAWWKVSPWGHTLEDQCESRRALALARQASHVVASDAVGAGVTLAWAWFWNGQDREALREASRALALPVTEDPQSLGREDRWRELANELLRQLQLGGSRARILQRLASEREYVQSQRVVSRSIHTAPGNTKTGGVGNVEHRLRTLTQMLEQLSEVENRDRRLVATRLRCTEVAFDHPKAGTSWEEARSAIRAADGVVASASYVPDAIDLQPQEGLVPIGMNPVTKLWEFYHLRSAWDEAAGVDPRDLIIPVHTPEGAVTLSAKGGIVLVLLPGGSFVMGAQKADETASNYDSLAEAQEAPPHRVPLSAFFCARREVTIAQWRHLMGRRTDEFWTGDAYPVVGMSWSEYTLTLESVGLSLPTEAQWEYACRGGSTTAYWTPGNKRVVRSPELPRGWIVNDFGIYDMGLSVLEWCGDQYGSYTYPVRAGDGARLVPEHATECRACRGSVPPWGDIGRSANRRGIAVHQASPRVGGVRAVRPLER